jgi:hypothetical protein
LSLKALTDALFCFPYRSEDCGWIFHVSSIFWNPKPLPIQGASPIARCRLSTEHGDAEQSDTAEKGGHQTHDGRLRIYLQSNQISGDVVPVIPLNDGLASGARSKSGC